MLRKITAHAAIVLGGMCFVLYVIDAIKGGAMSFINNDITKTFIALLSLISIFNSVISLAGQTNERRLAARLNAYRRPAAPQQRPADRISVRQAPPARPASRPAAPVRSASDQFPAQRPAARETVRPQRSAYNRSPYQNR